MTAAFYLSAGNPRWAPSTEGDLNSALQQGLLEESHYLDLKREVGAKPAANKELARDLAQFAIDSGTLIIGVEEHSDGEPPTLAAVPLAGLPERIEQIARSLPDPPLPITCHVIKSAADPELGYVFVSVPASGTAPHMVDGVYYGRGDKTRIRLSDSEIVRLHRLREDSEEAAEKLLGAYVLRDPVPTEKRKQAHLFVVAAPVTPRREMLLDAVHGDNWEQTFLTLYRAGLQLGLGDQYDRETFAPDLRHAGSFARRADGAALTDSGLTASRDLAERANPGAPFREDTIELEVTEDGVVRLMSTRLSDESQSGEQMLFTEMIPVLTRRLLKIAVAVADHTGYQGPWRLGFAATGIAGMGAWTKPGAWGSTVRVPKDQDDYRATTTASYAELLEMPGAATNRLVGRLLRAINQADALEVYTTDT